MTFLKCTPIITTAAAAVQFYHFPIWNSIICHWKYLRCSSYFGKNHLIVCIKFIYPPLKILSLFLLIFPRERMRKMHKNALIRRIICPFKKWKIYCWIKLPITSELLSWRHSSKKREKSRKQWIISNQSDLLNMFLFCSSISHHVERGKYGCKGRWHFLNFLLPTLSEVNKKISHSSSTECSACAFFHLNSQKTHSTCTH